MKEEIKITSLYKWWRNPILWWKDRKKVKLMNVLANQMWEDGMREEIAQLHSDVLFYGTAVTKKKRKSFMKDCKIP